MVSKSLKDYINDNIKDCKNELDLAYTIYILLGKELYYSPLYERYKDSNLVPNVEDISLDNPYVNTDTWSKLYSEILNNYGIETNIFPGKNKEVDFNVDEFKVRTAGTLYISNDVFDVSSDLTNIKFGLDVIYFGLINNQYREEFLYNIEMVNDRFNINKGKDFIILDDINKNIDRSKNMFNYGINFYNDFYKLCDGEVERRQLFERYYSLLFGHTSNEIINFYDDGILSKHLLVSRDYYFLETKDGFIESNYDEIMDLINNNKITIKDDNSMQLLCNKRLVKRK